MKWRWLLEKDAYYDEICRVFSVLSTLQLPKGERGFGQISGLVIVSYDAGVERVSVGR